MLLFYPQKIHGGSEGGLQKNVAKERRQRETAGVGFAAGVVRQNEAIDAAHAEGT